MAHTTHTTPGRPTTPRGVLATLVPRFTAAGDLDEAVCRRDVVRQLRAGVDGFVTGRTTDGRGTVPATLRERLTAIAVDEVRLRAWRRRVQVVVAMPAADADATIREVRRAAGLGADAALVAAPAGLTQPMLEAHVRAVADAGSLPVIVCDALPGTGTDVAADTFLRLAAHPRIVGFVETAGEMGRIGRICRDRPRGVAVLAGNDEWALPMIALGCDGVLSVISNRAPEDVVALCAAARGGDLRHARAIHERLLTASRADDPKAGDDVPTRTAHGPMGAPASSARRVDVSDPAFVTRTLRDLDAVFAARAV